MSAKITTAIPPRAFEICRDEIAAILALELPNQSLLNSDVNLNAPVFIERTKPFQNTELPAVNVLFASGEYDSYTGKTQPGSYVFPVHFYVTAKSTQDKRSDEAAGLKLSRLGGVIQAILSNVRYRTLGFPLGLIERVEVQKIEIADPVNNLDASTVMFGSLKIMVKVAESTTENVPGTLSEHITKFNLTSVNQVHLNTNLNP